MKNIRSWAVAFTLPYADWMTVTAAEECGFQAYAPQIGGWRIGTRHGRTRLVGFTSQEFLFPRHVFIKVGERDWRRLLRHRDLFRVVTTPVSENAVVPLLLLDEFVDRVIAAEDKAGIIRLPDLPTAQNFSHVELFGMTRRMTPEARVAVLRRELQGVQLSQHHALPQVA